METPPVTTKRSLVGSLIKSSLTPCRRLGLSRPSTSSLKKSLHSSNVSSPKTNESGFGDKLKSVESLLPVGKTPKPYCDERLKVPLKQSDVLNDRSGVHKVRRCLTIGSKIPAEYKSDLSNDKSANHCDKFVPGVFEGDIHSSKKRKVNPKETLSDKNVAECRSLNRLSSNHVHCHTLPTETKDEINDAIETVTPEVVEILVFSLLEKKKKLEQLKVQETYVKKHNLEELQAQTAKWRKAGQEALQYSVELAKHAGYSVTIKQLMNQHGFSAQLMGYNSEDDDFE